MNKVIKVMPRCYICNVSLGESSNTLFVEGQWIHYACAFRISIEKAKEKDNAQV